MYRPRRPRSSSDALSASFNGELLDSRKHCNSYDNLEAGEDSEGEDGPICVPALISPPRSAGEDVDLSPPDIGMASLDFDPMSFQCSAPDASYSFPLDEPPAGAEACALKRSPGSVCARTLGSELLSASFLSSLASPLLASDRPEARKLPASHSYSDKPTQAVSPIKCGQSSSLTPCVPLEPLSTEPPEAGAAAPLQPPVSPLAAARGSPPLTAAVLLSAAETSLSEAFQMELHSKLSALDSRAEEEQDGAACSQQQQGEHTIINQPDHQSH